MIKYRWQKAILQMGGKPYTEINTSEIWVQRGDPLFTNLLWANGHLVTVESSYVKWLDRGPEDFANDVPFVPYGEWVIWEWK